MITQDTSAFTIIIPHKNIPGLLRRCLDSIPRRTDLQIIVIDDNSDPNLVDFAHFPGLDDPAIDIIFTKKGKGAGYARNIGLSKAEGEWVLFADADDYYNSRCLHSFLDDYKNSTVDIVFYKASCVNSVTLAKTTRNDQLQLNNYIDSYIASFKITVENSLRYESSVPWGKLIKRRLIENYNIRFDETQKSNDVTFSYLAGYYAKNITTDNRIIYCVTVRNDSIGYGPQTIEKKLDFIYVTGKQKIFFRDHNLPYHRDSAAKMLLSLYFSDHAAYARGKEILFNLGFTYQEIADMIRQAVLDNFFHFFFNLILFLPKKIVKSINFFWMR